MKKIAEITKQLKETLPALVLVYKRKETPKKAKILLAITLAYALSPIDLIPDFIPVLGYLDDVVILPLLIKLSLKFIPEDILNECKEEAKNAPKAKKRFLYAVPILILWCILLAVILKHFLK
ncbi:YkvA family protein [Guggenheimella bovis]